MRELRNLCERLSIMLPGEIVEVEHLPGEFFGNASEIQMGDFTLPQEGVNLESLEIALIQQALDRTKGNRTKAAKLLGLTRDTLLYRMRKHGFRE